MNSNSNKSRRVPSPDRRSPRSPVQIDPLTSNEVPTLGRKFSNRTPKYRNNSGLLFKPKKCNSATPKKNRDGKVKTKPPKPAQRKPPRTPRGAAMPRQASSQLSNFVTKVNTPNRQTETDRSEMFYKEHLFATFQALKIVQELPPVNTKQLKAQTLNLPIKKGYEGRKLAVFDLDETLVHCCDDIDTSDPDFIVSITFEDGQVFDAGINLRPFALECLAEANKYFEVAVFTASHKCYADVVLDHIDPKRTLIQHRLYRENCLFTDGVYVKDLRVFSGRDLKDIVIIDNAAYSFAYQLDNGIPIISWHDDYTDRELYNLMDYLRLLAKSHDIREVNAETFHLHTFYDDYMEEFFGADLSAFKRSKSPDIVKNIAKRNRR